MNSEQGIKKILLICYSFPPFQGIGGRRWAKFLKYLSRADYELYVVGAFNEEKKESNWSKDVTGVANIHYYPVKTRFYNFFHNFKPTFFNKLAFQVTKNLLRRVYKGNFYDKALASNDLFYSKAKELIRRHHITNLVVTIAPNRLVEVGIRLKKEFPQLNFIVDVRDPWNICNDEWDHKFLTHAQREYELQVEKEAVAAADHVFSIADFLSRYYKKEFPASAGKIVTVPNGFDHEEVFYSEPKAGEAGNHRRNIVFTGTLYDNVTELFKEFIAALLAIEKSQPALLEALSFNFYMPRLALFEDMVARSQCKYIHFLDTVPITEVRRIINDAYACMLFLPPEYEFSLSTKFFEYVSQNKKILVFSKPGDTPDLIKKHGLGYVMLPGSIRADLEAALKDLQQGGSPSKHTFNIEDYSIPAITETIKPYFK